MQIPRSLKDVAAAGNIGLKDLSRSYRTLVTQLDIRMPIEDPVRSVPKIGSAIGVSPQTMRRAQEILRMAEAQGVTAGKDPMGLAGRGPVHREPPGGGGEDAGERGEGL